MTSQDVSLGVTVQIPLGLLKSINDDARARGMSRDEWIRSSCAAQFEPGKESKS